MTDDQRQMGAFAGLPFEDLRFADLPLQIWALGSGL
jgi:hypothetical protein